MTVKLARAKLACLDFVVGAGAQQIADLGGMWSVDGGYAAYLAGRYGVAVDLVDTFISNQFRQNQPVGVRWINGDFSRPNVLSQIRSPDTILMFDVLLHQADPDWRAVLWQWAPLCSQLVVAQPFWNGEQSVRLLELGRDAYFEAIPHHPRDIPYRGLFKKLDRVDPESGRLWRDAPHIWQWGIAVADLKRELAALGFGCVFASDPDRSLKSFTRLGLVFRKGAPIESGPISG